MRAQAAALLCHKLFWMLFTMLFKVRKQLPSSLHVWGVCLFLLIWGIAPGIELHRFRHRSQCSQVLFSGGILVFTHRLICFLQLFPCLHTEDRRGRRERRGEERGRGKRRGRARKGEREREKEEQREKERESQKGGKEREMERKRERVLERACGCVLLVEIQQVSKVLLTTFGKCTHVAMTTYLL